MKIGILGSGSVAKSLGSGFLKHGYEVMLGTRDLSKLEDWKSTAGAGASIGSFSDTANFGEIVVLAVKGAIAENVINLAGLDNLKGKTVIDATNPIDDSKAPINGVLNFFTNLDESLMEKLQKLSPESNFVKSFSCVGAHLMVNPTFADGKPTMFICGNDDKAKSQTSEILDRFGWDVADMGKVESARAIEPLCMLWCIPGFQSNQWVHAFKLLK